MVFLLAFDPTLDATGKEETNPVHVYAHMQSFMAVDPSLRHIPLLTITKVEELAWTLKRYVHGLNSSGPAVRPEGEEKAREVKEVARYAAAGSPYVLLQHNTVEAVMEGYGSLGEMAEGCASEAGAQRVREVIRGRMGESESDREREGDAEAEAEVEGVVMFWREEWVVE